MRRKFVVLGVVIIGAFAVTAFFVVPFLAANPVTGVELVRSGAKKGSLTLTPQTLSKSPVEVTGQRVIVEYNRSGPPVEQWLSVGGLNVTPVGSYTNGKSVVVGYSFSAAVNTSGAVYFFDNTSSAVNISFILAPLKFGDLQLISDLASADFILLFIGVGVLAAGLILREKPRAQTDA